VFNVFPEFVVNSSNVIVPLDASVWKMKYLKISYENKFPNIPAISTFAVQLPGVLENTGSMSLTVPLSTDKLLWSQASNPPFNRERPPE
jgi:hypothetical protein